MVFLWNIYFVNYCGLIFAQPNIQSHLISSLYQLIQGEVVHNVLSSKGKPSWNLNVL
jgi:hypothetical protein